MFAIAMAVSNIALLRHERPRIQNALGLAVSLLLIAGEGVGVLLFIGDFSGSEWEDRVNNMLKNVYASAFVYFECMLAGSVICGVKAARHRPDYDKDFIIILGCWFRPDGTLPPLLRGRVDRAVEYWQDTLEKTGREAYIIPSQTASFWSQATDSAIWTRIIPSVLSTASPISTIMTYGSKTTIPFLS